MGQPIQLEGTIELGPVGESLTDFSDDITSLVIVRGREQVPRQPTFGNAQRIQGAGAREDQVTINFLHDTAASNVWSQLWDALDTDDSVLEFSATLKDEAVSATNPEFTGKIVVTGLETGGEVGTRNNQSQTYSAFDIVKSTGG